MTKLISGIECNLSQAAYKTLMKTFIESKKPSRKVKEEDDPWRKED